VRADNPEARAAVDTGLPYTSQADAVHDFFIRGKHSVVITGTHGKTTCTSLIGWILIHAGLDPSVLVGGVAQNLGGSTRLGEGEHFVIEGDEYDTAFFDKTPKFWHYDARTLLITSCEFDHADIYDSLEQVQSAFRTGIDAMPASGRIVAATDSPLVRALVEGTSASVEGYGFCEPALWRVSDVTFDDECTELTLWRGDDRLTRIRTPLFGRHNVENVLGSAAVCCGLGVDPQRVAEALELYRGVRRRQELRGESSGLAVIDDFAHHPTEVRETLASMRTRYPGRRLWAVFEPRTNTNRRRFFEQDLSSALASADAVLLAPVYRAEQIPDADRLRPQVVIDALRAGGTEAHALAGTDEIIEHIASQNGGHDVALIMSNGAFGGIWERLLARLRSNR
jgi:UDP-N-acetylmuramate: L-alanyl-gamma-D-glutamyl-meso-diaminopimelate ligase